MASKIPMKNENGPRWDRWVILAAMLIGTLLVTIYGQDVFEALFVG